MKHGPSPDSELITRAQQLDDGEERFRSAGRYCPSCYTFSRDLLVLSRATPLEDNEEEIVEWNVSIAKLADATEKGCEFCAFIASQYFNNRSSIFVWGNSVGNRDFGCCEQADPSENVDKRKDAVKVLRGVLEDHPDAWFGCYCQTIDMDPVTRAYTKLWLGMRTTDLPQEVYRKLLGTRSELILEVYATNDSPAAKWITTRPLCTDFGSRENIVAIQAWLKQCMDEHHQCSRYEQGELPSRVIEILEDGKVRLYETGAEKGEYITLSYCWGGSQMFVTTRADIESVKQPFEVSRLPQTAQDAIIVATRLGVKYVWIDALCIVQDSEEDMNHELARMAQYYKRSYLTLVASTKSSTQGFLGVHGRCEKHPDSTLPKDLLRLSVLCPDFSVTDIHFREENPYFLSQEPIAERAWTFQECFLSPRVLMFGDRVIWQCRSAIHSDGGAEDWSFDEDGLVNRRIAVDMGRTMSEKSLNDDSNDDSAGPKEDNDASTEPKKQLLSEGPYELWHRAVQEFSGRALTFPEDKLPAISAAAAEFGRLLPHDAYVAGLWKPRLPLDLLWTTHPSLAGKKPAAWRAPSWSWAAVDNKASFERLPPPEAECLAVVHLAHAEPLSADVPFGRVASGRIEMTAPCIDLGEPQKDFLRRQYTPVGPFGFSARDSSLRMLRDITFQMKFGDGGEGQEGEFEFATGSIMALLFGVDETIAAKDEEGNDVERDGSVLWGLVLEPAEEKGAYMRTTMFSEMRANKDKELPWSHFNVRLNII